MHISTGKFYQERRQELTITMNKAVLPCPLLPLDGINEMGNGQFSSLGAPYLFYKELDIRQRTMFSLDNECSGYETNQVDIDEDRFTAIQEATEISLYCGAAEGYRREGTNKIGIRRLHM